MLYTIIKCTNNKYVKKALLELIDVANLIP